MSGAHCIIYVLSFLSVTTGAICRWLSQWLNSHVDRGQLVTEGLHGPIDRYVQLRVAHAPGMPGTFSRHRGLAIPTCITALAWRLCRDACRDRYLAVSFEVGGGEDVPDIPCACAIRTFAYLARGPCGSSWIWPKLLAKIHYIANALITAQRCSVNTYDTFKNHVFILMCPIKHNTLHHLFCIMLENWK